MQIHMKILPFLTLFVLHWVESQCPEHQDQKPEKHHVEWHGTDLGSCNITKYVHFNIHYTWLAVKNKLIINYHIRKCK